MYNSGYQAFKLMNLDGLNVPVSDLNLQNLNGLTGKVIKPIDTRIRLQNLFGSPHDTRINRLQNLFGSPHDTRINRLMNLDSNTAVHNGATVDGSYFKMGNVNVHDGAVQIMSDVGKNRVDIDRLTGNAGSTTVFMAPVGLMNLDSDTAEHNGATVDGSYFQMGDVNVHDGAVQIMSDVGKNRVDIDKLSGEEGSTTVFMAPVSGLVNLMQHSGFY